MAQVPGLLCTLETRMSTAKPVCVLCYSKDNRLLQKMGQITASSYSTACHEETKAANNYYSRICCFAGSNMSVAVYPFFSDMASMGQTYCAVPLSVRLAQKCIGGLLTGHCSVNRRG